MNAPALPSIGGNRLGKIANFALPVAVAALAASAAYAGADTTFTPALQKFTYKLCSIYVLNRFGYRRNRKCLEN
jgi:hypothetical protein